VSNCIAIYKPYNILNYREKIKRINIFYVETVYSIRRYKQNERGMYNGRRKK